MLILTHRAVFRDRRPVFSPPLRAKPKGLTTKFVRLGPAGSCALARSERVRVCFDHVVRDISSFCGIAWLQGRKIDSLKRQKCCLNKSGAVCDTVRAGYGSVSHSFCEQRYTVKGHACFRRRLK